MVFIGQVSNLIVLLWMKSLVGVGTFFVSLIIVIRSRDTLLSSLWVVVWQSGLMKAMYLSVLSRRSAPTPSS
jgi:hypothetical protein